MAKYIKIDFPYVNEIFLIFMITLSWIFLGPGLGGKDFKDYIWPFLFTLIFIIYLIKFTFNKKINQKNNSTELENKSKKLKPINIIDVNSKDEQTKNLGLKIIIFHAFLLIFLGISQFLGIDSKIFLILFRLVIISILLIASYAGIINKVSIGGSKINSSVVRGKYAIILGVFYLILALIVIASFFLKFNSPVLPIPNF
jgi:hypothetical protein